MTTITFVVVVVVVMVVMVVVRSRSRSRRRRNGFQVFPLFGQNKFLLSHRRRHPLSWCRLVLVVVVVLVRFGTSWQRGASTGGSDTVLRHGG